MGKEETEERDKGLKEKKKKTGEGKGEGSKLSCLLWNYDKNHCFYSFRILLGH